MQLEKIITLANKKTMIQFLAMERSLRAVGCQLPIWVIPYDDTRFDLPEGSQWWVIPEIVSWLDAEKTHQTMRKYQCFTTPNYQFVDTDVCFVRNPEEVLKNVTGFITSCGHWHNPDETLTVESKKILWSKSTVWQQNIFNTGQFACDKILYTVDELRQVATQPEFIETCIRLKWHEQPGINLLVNASGVEISNLTLPPLRMESTWAGDYPNEYENYWEQPDRKPYFIHWAGNHVAIPKPINELFFQYLTKEEREKWDKDMAAKLAVAVKQKKSLYARLRRVKKAWKALLSD